MERDVDNANPTILSLSQLPSRRLRRTAGSKGPESKFDHILFPSKGTRLWGFPDASVSSGSDQDEDDEALDEEPIDEQEIYGQ
jgi:hypothetical protein